MEGLLEESGFQAPEGEAQPVKQPPRGCERMSQEVEARDKCKILLRKDSCFFP